MSEEKMKTENLTDKKTIVSYTRVQKQDHMKDILNVAFSHLFISSINPDYLYI